MRRAARKWFHSLPWVLLACLIVGSAMAIYTFQYETPVYRAVYTFYAAPDDETDEEAYTLASDCQRLTQTWAFQQEVLSHVPSDGHCFVSVQAVSHSHMLETVVTGPDAQVVCGLANAVGEALCEKAEQLLGARAVWEIERAQLPVTPDRTGKARRIAVSVLVTFLVGSLLGMCLAKEHRALAHNDPKAGRFRLGAVGRLRREERRYLKKVAKDQTMRSFLGSVNRFIREDVREIVLALRTDSAPCGSLVLSPVGTDEEDDAFTVLLAQELAQQGFHVLLLEMEARGPVIRRLLDVRPRADLSDYLNGRAEWTETVVSTQIPTLAFVDWLHPGMPVADLAATEAFSDFLRSAQTHFDFVLLHTAPLEGSTDAAMLSLVADGIILIAQDRAYSLEALEASAASIARLGKPVKGVVFTQARTEGC